MEIGEKIRILRKEKRIQQVDLASTAGINSQYLNKIEKGKVTNVGDEILGKLADALGVNLSYLHQVDSAMRVGFTPCCWAAPLLNVIIDSNLSDVKLAYSYTTDGPLFFEPSKLSVDSSALGAVTTLPTVLNEIIAGDDAEVKILSEKELKSQLRQEFDFVFLPSTIEKEKNNMIPVASICNTVQGGLYAIVFPNDADAWSFETSVLNTDSNLTKKELIRKKAKLDFLKKYQDKSDREGFINNSMFFYQKDTISETFLQEILSMYNIDNIQTFEIKSTRPGHLINLLNAVLKGTQESNKRKNNNNTFFDKILKEAYISHSSGKVSLPSLLNFSPLSNASFRQFLEKIDFSGSNTKGFTVFLAWEPFASLIREAYETENPEKFCIMFNISRFIYPPTNLEVLYECYVNADRLEDLKRNKSSSLLFTEINNAINSLNNKTSLLPSPEISEIATILGMPTSKLQSILRKINFNLKFYSNWVL